MHARLVAERRAAVTARQIEQAAAARQFGDAGARADVAITHHEVAASGAVVAQVSIAIPAGSRSLRIVVLPTGELGGLGFLPALALVPSMGMTCGDGDHGG